MHYLIFKGQNPLFLVCDDSRVETPLPIPNREVKHTYADNSLGEDKELQTFFFAIKYLSDQVFFY